MTIGKYLYISGIIRNIYYYSPNIIGKLVRLLFWIHPKTTVIHPSNRGLLAHLTRQEAEQFPEKEPNIIKHISTYKQNLKKIRRYHRVKSMLTSKTMKASREQILKQEILTFESSKLFELTQHIETKQFRDIVKSYDALKPIAKYPKLWEAFQYAKFCTKSYAFNGRVLSYREITHPKNPEHKYSDCVETFFRNLCIVANFRPNNFQNLKEDRDEDHIEWIDWLLTIPGFEYVIYPEIKSCKENLNVFLKYNNISMEEIGFVKTRSGWHLENDMFDVDAYLIKSHASMKTTYHHLKSVPVPKIYNNYISPTHHIFLDSKNIPRAARFIAYYPKNDSIVVDAMSSFISFHIDDLLAEIHTPQMADTYLKILNSQFNLLGISYFKRKYPKEFEKANRAIKLLKDKTTMCINN